MGPPKPGNAGQSLLQRGPGGFAPGIGSPLLMHCVPTKASVASSKFVRCSAQLQRSRLKDDAA